MTSSIERTEQTPFVYCVYMETKMKLTYTHANYPRVDTKPTQRETHFEMNDLFAFVDDSNDAPSQKEVIAWICLQTNCKYDHGRGCGIFESDEFHAHIDALENASDRVKGLKKEPRQISENGGGPRAGITNAIKQSIGEKVITKIAWFLGIEENDVDDYEITPAYIECVMHELLIIAQAKEGYEIEMPAERIKTDAQKLKSVDALLVSTIKTMSSLDLTAEVIVEKIKASGGVITLEQVNNAIAS